MTPPTCLTDDARRADLDVSLDATTVREQHPGALDPCRAQDARAHFLADAAVLALDCAHYTVAMSAAHAAGQAVAAWGLSLREMDVPSSVGDRFCDMLYQRAVASLGERLSRLRSASTGLSVTVDTLQTLADAFPVFAAWQASERAMYARPALTTNAPVLVDVAAALWDAYPLERATALGLRTAALAFVAPFSFRWNPPKMTPTGITFEFTHLRDSHGYGRTDVQWHHRAVECVRATLDALAQLCLAAGRPAEAGAVRLALSDGTVPGLSTAIVGRGKRPIGAACGLTCFGDSARLWIRGDLWAELAAILQPLGVLDVPAD